MFAEYGCVYFNFGESNNNFLKQDRTGRILFKLFDKDPSHFPGTLRTQVWSLLFTLASCYYFNVFFAKHIY